jgi:hypothetical protein
MRMWRPEHFQMQHIRHRHVERIARLAGDDRFAEGAAQARAACSSCYVLLGIGDAMQRVINAVITGAAAKIALQEARQVLARLRIKGRGGHDHAGGAEAALKGLRIEKCLLHGVQLAVACQPLDGSDLVPCGAEGWRQARVEGLTIDMDGASATIALVAALLDAEKSKSAQKGAQALARKRFRRDPLPVDGVIHAGGPCLSSARICSA